MSEDSIELLRTILIHAVLRTGHPLGQEWGRQPLGSGSALALALLLFGFLRDQDGTETVQVARDHSQRDVSLEPVDTVVGAAF